MENLSGHLACRFLVLSAKDCYAGWRLAAHLLSIEVLIPTELPNSQTCSDVLMKSTLSSFGGKMRILSINRELYQNVLFINSLDPLMKVPVYLMDGDLQTAICKSTSKHTQTLNRHRCTNEIMKLPNNGTACTWGLMGGTDFS